MSDKSTDLAAVVEAINDLTRVTLAVSGKFSSKSDAVRKLAELSIPPARIGGILNLPTQQVTSVLAKAKNVGKSKNKSISLDAEGGADDAEK